MNTRPKIRLIARGTYECADIDTCAAGLSMREAYTDWLALKVAKVVRIGRQPHLSLRGTHPAHAANPKGVLR